MFQMKPTSLISHAESGGVDQAAPQGECKTNAITLFSNHNSSLLKWHSVAQSCPSGHFPTPVSDAFQDKMLCDVMTQLTLIWSANKSMIPEGAVKSNRQDPLKSLCIVLCCHVDRQLPSYMIQVRMHRISDI